LPLFLLLLLPKTALCAPNGYTQIPIAKVFGNGVAAFSLNMSDVGYPRSLFGTVYTMQYGLLNRFEAGFDYQAQPTSQETWLGNAKYLLVHEPGRLPDVACGVINIASHEKALPYLVATTQPGNLGISLGLTGTNTTRGLAGMGGLAYNLSPNVQIVADIIGGRENYGTVGIIAALTKTTTLNVAYTHPNSSAIGGSSGQQGFIVNLAYTFHALHSHHASSGDGSGDKNPTADGDHPGQS
jgi:hypothetical protein